MFFFHQSGLLASCILLCVLLCGCCDACNTRETHNKAPLLELISACSAIASNMLTVRQLCAIRPVMVLATPRSMLARLHVKHVGGRSSICSPFYETVLACSLSVQRNATTFLGDDIVTLDMSTGQLTLARCGAGYMALSLQYYTTTSFGPVCVCGCGCVGVGVGVGVGVCVCVCVCV